GKTPGKDAAENKPTYVSLLGLSEARAFADELREAALAALEPLGDAGARLAQLADFIVLRDR
ncbi:MAG: geranyl transferase, partial [Achromobacter pestifer]